MHKKLKLLYMLRKTYILQINSFEKLSPSARKRRLEYFEDVDDRPTDQRM